KYPFYILNINLDPSVIDFNVHPKKLHVRFEREKFVYNKVYNVIRGFVEDLFIVKESKYISTELHDFVSKEEKVLKPIEEISKDEIKEEEQFQQQFLKLEESIQLSLEDQIISEKSIEKLPPETFLREKYIISKNFPKLRLISHTGQLSNKLYVVLEGFNENNEEGLFILDQHAASERINKERFLEAYETAKMSKQKLISALKVEVSPSEKYFLQDNLNEIRKLGFNFQHFGGNTFLLREVPTIMEKVPKLSIIKEIISDITEIGKDRSFSEVKEDIINYLACHKSVRGGDDLSLNDIRNLLIDLAACKDSYHCAHGRPTLRFLSFSELDKLFKRTG
ncbi:MAG: hypothetical protein ACFFG0_43850, partial [Candidatus Thorarchaeota archaeon]